MTDTINNVAAAEHVPAEPATPVDQQQLAERLLALAKEQGHRAGRPRRTVEPADQAGAGGRVGDGGVSISARG
jgi:hypothetical protein